jgi:NAD+ diphosphatase
MHHITPSRPNAYTGGRLDRAGHHREDAVYLEAAWHHPATRFVPFWRGKAAITGAAELPRASLLTGPAPAGPHVFLGEQDGAAIFAIDISAQEVEPSGFTDIRALTSLLPADDAVILATARGVLHWRATHTHCPRCGAPTRPTRGGWVVECTGCGTEHFPRTDCAVIMLVFHGDNLLLGQSHKFPVERNFYSTLAGFVEPGESLEEAVRREVFEETGVRVGEVAYHSSQPWPFPASLMLGFYAQAITTDIVLDVTEMRDARWMTPADIANRKELGFQLPPADSIARRLIEDFLLLGNR